MKRFTFYLIGFILGLIRYWPLLVLSGILFIVGFVWNPICTYIGFGFLGLNLILSFIGAWQMRPYAGMLDGDHEINALIEQALEKATEYEKLHGEALLCLSDDELWEAVFNQNLALCEEAEDTEQELSLFAGARRTVYIVMTFDAEVQNGGLCQFFVNSSRCLAPYVSEALAAVGAKDHQKLYDGFIAANGIDISHLDSFQVSGIRGFRKQTKRYDFDAFDDRYYELPPLEEQIAHYIRSNITQF